MVDRIGYCGAAPFSIAAKMGAYTSSGSSPISDRREASYGGRSEESGPALKKARRAPLSLMGTFDHNMLSEILSFLDQKEIFQFGMTCSKNMVAVTDPRLWTRIEVNNANCMNMTTLAKLLTYPNANFPLRSLALTSSVSKLCTCVEGSMCSHCSKSVVVEQCNDEKSCHRCDLLKPVRSKLCTLHNFTMTGIEGFPMCSLDSVLRDASMLRKIDFANDMDVNLVLGIISRNCPALEDISFRYTHVLEFEEQKENHPLMLPSTAKQLVASCPNVKKVRFCHYVLDEDCAQELLSLTDVREADLSDNENLTGVFLLSVLERWTLLEKLVLRDCTELDHDCVHGFTDALTVLRPVPESNQAKDEEDENDREPVMEFVYCPYLSCLDFSCQWSFIGDSLISEELLARLSTTRGPHFCWREDQCDVAGFGVDPDAGIDSIEIASGEIDVGLGIIPNSAIAAIEQTAAEMAGGYALSDEDEEDGNNEGHYAIVDGTSVGVFIMNQFIQHNSKVAPLSDSDSSDDEDDENYHMGPYSAFGAVIAPFADVSGEMVC